MFHITNGDSANDWLAEAGISGEFLSWDDVLHEGPVPAGLDLHELSLIRARFISFCGWATEFEAQTHFQARDARFLAAAESREVVIWNSPELFDQLHLLQILGCYPASSAQKNPPKLVFVDRLFGDPSQSPVQLAKALETAEVVGETQWVRARELWQLLMSANPRALAAVAAEPIAEFPWMQAGIQRLLQEYPDPYGVSLTERHALQAVSSGANMPVDMFRYVRDLEAVPFMGDASFWQIVAGLCNSEHPLLARSDGRPFELPDIFAPGDAFRGQVMQCTALGAEVLSGASDWLTLHRVDRWIGGVHLNPENCWRWDGGRFSRR